MKGISENLCTHGGDMLAYLYDEMQSADRDRFELHLSDCGTCIDEFAELSQSRYPVFEWKQVEFDPMPTPRIAIDLAKTANAGWFNKIKAAFAFNPGYAFGGVLVLLLAGVVASVLLFRVGVEEIAGREEPSPSPAGPIVRTITPKDPEQSQASTLPQPKSAVQPKIDNSTSKPEARPVRAKATQPIPKKQNVPVYSTVDDDEDDSLRLSDIFAELDTSE